MNIVSLKLDQIEIGKARLRSVHDGYAAEIAASFKELGQLAPIGATAPKKEGGKYGLEYGLTRVVAAQLAGWDAIDAIIYPKGGIEARKREIEENLIRRELTILARAASLAEWEKFHPKGQNGGDRRSDQFSNLENRSKRFSLSAAEKIGISETAIGRLLKIHKGLSPETRAIIENTKIEDHQGDLEKLAEVEDKDQQLLIARRMVEEEVSFSSISPKDISTGLDTASQKQYDAFARHFPKYTDEGRRRIIQWLVDNEYILAAQVRLP